MSLLNRSFIISTLLINTLIYSPTLLDYFHHSRFLYAAISLAIFSLLFAWQANKNKAYIASLQDVIILAFALLNFTSIFWAKQQSEAIFYAQKWLIFTSAFVLFKVIVQQDFKSFVQFLSRVACLLTVIIVVLVSVKLGQLASDHGFSNKALYELKAIFGHKSLISTYLVLLIPLNLLAWPDRSKYLNRWILVLLASQLILIILLQSRAMYLAIVAVMMIMLRYFYSQRKSGAGIGFKPVILGSVLLLGLVGTIYLVASPELRERINPLHYFDSQTSGERRFVWYKTQGLIHDHPFLGVGAGNWKLEFPRYGVEGAYRLQDQDVIFTRAHNDFLEICSEVGIPGLLLYLGLFALPLIQFFKKKNRNQAWIRHLLTAGIFSFIISSFFDFPRERVEYLVMLALYLALYDATSLSTAQIRISPLQLKGVLWTFCFALGLCVYSGYFRFQGESRMRDLFAARLAEDWPKVISTAKEATNKWYRLDPSAVPIAFYQGIAHYSMQEVEEALVAFSRANAYNPNNFHVINNMATVLVGQAKYDQALELLYEALRINPRFEEAIFNLAFCLNALGRHQEALDQVTLIPRNSEKKDVFIRELTKVLDAK